MSAVGESEVFSMQLLRVYHLSLEKAEDGLALTLRMRAASSNRELTVRFAGVTELRFRGPTTDLNGLVRLQLEDVAAAGMEEVRFRVKDYEEEFVSFSCRSFDDASDAAQR